MAIGFLGTFLFLVGLVTVSCQLNRIKPVLVQCYNDTAIPGITNANNRPPATLNVFLELIRRLEDANPNLSTRDLSVLILQRLRQDGITSTAQTVSSSLALPFGISGLEAYKSTEILTNYLPNSTSTLKFGDLQPRDICALHYMISSTIDDKMRNDEMTTCTRSARYTARMRRDVEKIEPHSKSNHDVETVISGRALGISPRRYELSQCPLELGVFLTNYGTVKGGQVLGGISSGLNPQRAYGVDNRYAATIVGELAEAALVQGGETINVGVQGGWNSTINPRYYFIEKNKGTEITDAEIRGSLDGLYMALQMDKWKQSEIKISQIIDMYYTPYQKGVLNANFKACNRNVLFTEQTRETTLQEETRYFMDRLDDTASYGNTFTPEVYPKLTDATYRSFVSYIPQMEKTDLACVPVEKIERVATDLMIFVDSAWEYDLIQLVLSNILDNIDVNRFGTRYTIYNAVTGNNLTHLRTNNLLDFYNQYNLTVHRNYSAGFDYTKVMEIAENSMKSKLENSSYYGAESTVVLMIPRSSPSEVQIQTLNDRREFIKKYLPDMNIIVLGVGSQSDYGSIVLNQDFITLVDSTRENDVKSLGKSVVERIANVNKAIVNPSCGSSFNGGARTFTLTEYVEPKGVNYYRIHPNYFYTGDGQRNLQITENSYGVIQLCISRSQAKPSNSSDICQTLRSSVHTIDITNYCRHTLTDCAPIYLSVEGISVTNIRCKEAACRFPDNIKYTIKLENVGCASSSIRIAVNHIALATVLIWTLL